MAMTVLTPATKKAFCILAQVRKDLEFPDSFTDDNDYLNELIVEAGSTIEEITERVFAYEEIEETIPGHGHTQMLVSRYPLDNTKAITVRRRFFDGSETSIAAQYLSIADERNGIIECSIGFGDTTAFERGVTPAPIAGSALAQWVVTYWAGYVMADHTPEGEITLPPALRRIARDMVTTWYLGRGQKSNLRSQRIADASKTYSEESAYIGFEARLKRWGSIV